MDVRTYLLIIMKRWYILLACVVLTVVATLLLTLRLPRVYESVSTFVIRPHSSLILQDEFVSTLDTLSRRVEINNTFAEVTTSKLIRDRAAEQLGLSSDQRSGLSANGRVLVGTNILELTIKGNDPELAQAFAEAVSIETVNYISSLYDVFELGQLDAATINRSPVSPNIPINLALGFVLGTALGLVLVFLYEYLRVPDAQQHSFDIIDGGTGIYNRSYLEMRLSQEVSRANRNDSELSLALIRLKSHGGLSSSADIGREVMPSMAIIFDPLLRDEDLLARFDETTFALMMPDTSGDEAQDLVENLRLRLGSVHANQGQLKNLSALRGAAGVTEMAAGEREPNALFGRAADALREAERGTYGRVILRSPEPMEGDLRPEAAGEPTVAHWTFAEQQVQKPVLTRAALKLAQQYGIDPDEIEGSGKDGRVLKSDVQALIRTNDKLGFST